MSCDVIGCTKCFVALEHGRNVMFSWLKLHCLQIMSILLLFMLVGNSKVWYHVFYMCYMCVCWLLF